MTLAGADISSHQGTLDLDMLARSVAFVLSKATEGVGYADPTFPRNWSECKRVGLVRGAYHFARPDLGNAPHDEATWFVQAVVLEEGDLLGLDYEAAWDGDVVGWCFQFLEEVRARVGFRPLIYLNQSLVAGYDWRSVIGAGYGLWLADYVGSPTDVPATPWPFVAIKQWTSAGALPGIVPRLDLDTFFGTREQIVAYGKPKGVTMDTPQRLGQSAAYIEAHAGDLVELETTYAYPGTHPEGRPLLTKLRAGMKTGPRVIVVYPPVDPDADATLVLDAEPCYFLVDVLP